MTTPSNIKLTIAFNDPDLDSEERDEQVQQLWSELKQLDEVETVDRVLDPNPPEGSKAIGRLLMREGRSHTLMKKARLNTPNVSRSNAPRKTT